ncbi:MAG: sodium pump decarboxylase subunit gamma [Arcobacter sp.]|uniref:OadG family protein n=1 Tax=uncultured Arcobacter sp. TaxID=165434 RepID=UPI000CA6CDE0|nr:OadG family transporter subunit [uncultured Arcobacter sp.]PLY11413.1 MAG: sodium pump decarboxylase subunit gamma [Arcobacter sp.]
METNLVMEAFKFMILGMGIVFSFLIIMVFALKAQAALIGKFFPEKDNIKTAKKVQPSVATSDTAKKIAAISAVIQHHNNQKG